MVLTIIFLLSGDIFYLIELTGFAYAVLISSSIGALIYMRIRRPELTRPMKVSPALRDEVVDTRADPEQIYIICCHLLTISDPNVDHRILYVGLSMHLLKIFSAI